MIDPEGMVHKTSRTPCSQYQQPYSRPKQVQMSSGNEEAGLQGRLQHLISTSRSQEGPSAEHFASLVAPLAGISLNQLRGITELQIDISQDEKMAEDPDDVAVRNSLIRARQPEDDIENLASLPSAEAGEYKRMYHHTNAISVYAKIEVPNSPKAERISHAL